MKQGGETQKRGKRDGQAEWKKKPLRRRNAPRAGGKRSSRAKFPPAARPFVPPGPRGVAKRFSLADLTSSWRCKGVLKQRPPKSLRRSYRNRPDESVFTKNLLIHRLVFPPGYADPADNDSDGSHKGKKQIYVQFRLARKCPSPQPSPLQHQATHSRRFGFPEHRLFRRRGSACLLSASLYAVAFFGRSLVPHSCSALIGTDKHTSTFKHAHTHRETHATSYMLWSGVNTENAETHTQDSGCGGFCEEGKKPAIHFSAMLRVQCWRHAADWVVCH
ncbi:hypothetical protein ECC02_005384 [Trypanosoma cruzi]|uniref:Uncharacterized protein n=1 Tax=Trypanosoma cruzi TaxID=5693 RepID=A0A7J6Y5Z4_TRYCR|nr:hypothetical protein ECC02_005384 [Trypanosoma cruzi]